MVDTKSAHSSSLKVCASAEGTPSSRWSRMAMPDSCPPDSGSTWGTAGAGPTDIPAAQLGAVLSPIGVAAGAGVRLGCPDVAGAAAAAAAAATHAGAVNGRHGGGKALGQLPQFVHDAGHRHAQSKHDMWQLLFGVLHLLLGCRAGARRAHRRRGEDRAEEQ